MVNNSSKVMPNYELNKYGTSLILYFNNNDDLIIVGEVDRNYICWVSLTKTYEKDKNEAIFNHLANEPFVFVSQSRLIGLLDYSELKRYYRANLRRTNENGMVWRTPFGHFYGKDQIKNNGRYFANSVSNFLDVLYRRCQFREADGAYEEMLDFWFEELSKGESDVLYYQVLEPLVEMIKCEGTLLCLIVRQ